MNKKLFFVFGIILCCFSSLSATLDCIFRDGTFIIVGTIYQCSLVSDKISSRQTLRLYSPNDGHRANKSNKDVLGFYARQNKIEKFPKELQKFPNLKSIQMNNCQLQALYQSDLKPFADLILIYMESNLIEVLEEDLFAFNPNLKLIGFGHNQIVHIDPNVFDHLTQLSDFYFYGVPCIGLSIYSSVDKVKEAIGIIKTKCLNSDFMALVDKVGKFEDKAASLSPDEFEKNFIDLENELKNSNFFSFRPISSRFAKLKNLKTLGNMASEELQQSTIKPDLITPKVAKYTETCSQTDQFAALDMKFTSLSNNLTLQMTDSITNANNSFSDIKKSINNFEASQKTIQNSHKSFQDSTTTYITSINSELKTTQEAIKLLKDKVKESVSDTTTAISDVKTNQIDIQASLSKLKTTQNDLQVSMNDLKAFIMKNENCDGKFNEILENFEEKFADFEAKSVEKFDKIEKSLTNVGHKMTINLDEKIKEIEKRMMKKFEELLNDNLAKKF
ncbi:unnamed protein product [Chironomus riparius]|uniref:Uncharacterized protein n=1 Tax=Chironomus riparius TaxID=315576 RepID=A0A9N9WZM2_9DIPT|nr:unnamed protein product [Chironomus riparius]